MSSSSSWYDGAWSAGTSTWGLCVEFIEQIIPMVDPVARVVAWPWIADAGRRPRDRHSGGATGRSSGWRSGAARRDQAAAGVVEPAIYYPTICGMPPQRSAV